MKAAMSDDVKKILQDEDATEELLIIATGKYGHDPKIVTLNKEKYQVTLLKPSTEQ